MGRIFLAVIFAFILCPTQGHAEEERSWKDRLTFSGWVETIQSVGVYEPNDVITSRVHARLNGEADLGPFYGYASIDAEKNWEIESESDVDLHELWLEHAEAGWDLRLGRQTIIWGKADGVQITDVISPPDYTEAMTRDLDEIRMPVDAMKFRVLGSNIDVEMIWIPRFQEAKFPEKGNPWFIDTPVPSSISVRKESADRPSFSLRNSEFAMRVSAYFSGFDAAASIFHTWDDRAAMHRTVSNSGGGLDVLFSPKHHRMTVLGLEFSRPWSDFVFRGEAACYLGRYFETTELQTGPLRRDAVKWLGGVDWTPGNDWTIIGQLTGHRILNYTNRFANHRHDLMATLNISKKLFRQTLTISNMVYYNFNDEDAFLRLKGDYEFSDGVHAVLGLDLFEGEKGNFGVYHNNSQLWLKLKYSF